MIDLSKNPITIILASLLIAILIWLPRGLTLDRFATADEHAWLARSGNFYRALVNGDYAETFQRHHPGVLVTWAGTLGFVQKYPDYAQDAPRQFGWLTEEIEPFLREQGRDPVGLLAAGRSFVVLIISLALLISFLLAARLIGLWPALAGFALIALDPFHIGLSRLLHLDGLLSSLMFLSLLAFLHFQQSQQRASLILSAVAAGLAWLTRSPGLFLAPFLLLIVIAGDLRLRGLRVTIQNRQSQIVNFFTWFIIASLTFVILWPAMWVDPLGSVWKVISAAGSYATEGHLKPTFFNGEVISGDPGVLFYPISYLWRATPVTLLGLVFALVGLLIRRGIWAKPQNRKVGSVLLLYALLFMLFMDIGAKKFDRYLLPVYPALNLLAGMGLAGVVDLLARRLGVHPAQSVKRGIIVNGLFLLLIIAAQASFSLPTYPYYLSYYNPLLGGSARAPDVMQIGWGEGADQAARWLAEKADAAQTTVASAYTNGPFSYFYPGQTLPITFWHRADYAVLYAQDFQRRLPSPRQIRYFEQLEPAHTVLINGLRYAQIYALEDAPWPRYVTEWRMPSDDAAEGDVAESDAADALFRLVSYQLPSSRLLPGDSLPLTLYLQGLRSVENDLNVIVRLLDSVGNEVAREEGWPWGSPTSGWQPDALWPDGHMLRLPEDVAPGPLRVEVAFNDPERGALLSAIRTQTGELLGEWLTLDFVTVGEEVEPMVRQRSLTTLGDLVEFKGLSPKVVSDVVQSDAKIGARIEAAAGDALTFSLFWGALAHMEIDYTVFVHVVGADGEMLVQSDRQPLGGFYPTSFWQTGRTVVDAVSLELPAGAAPGSYTIYAGMYDLVTGERLVVRRGGDVVGDSVMVGELVVGAQR